MELFAPGMFTPFNRHWYESGPVPVAWTLRARGAPLGTFWLWGCVVMVTCASARNGNSTTSDTSPIRICWREWFTTNKE